MKKLYRRFVKIRGKPRNKILAAVHVWITNPVTAPFVYDGLTYLFGAKILGLRKAYQPPDELEITTIPTVLHKAPEFLLATIIGGVILGLPLAVVGYYFSYSPLLRYQEKIRGNIARRTEKREHKKKKREKKSGRKIRVKTQNVK